MRQRINNIIYQPARCITFLVQLHKELIWSYSLLLNHDLSLLFILSSLPPCSKSSIIVSSTLIITTRLSFIPSPDVLLPSLPAIFPRAHLSLLSFSLFPSYNFLSSLPFSWLCRRKKKVDCGINDPFSPQIPIRPPIHSFAHLSCLLRSINLSILPARNCFWCSFISDLWLRPVTIHPVCS